MATVSINIPIELIKKIPDDSQKSFSKIICELIQCGIAYKELLKIQIEEKEKKNQKELSSYINVE